MQTKHRDNLRGLSYDISAKISYSILVSETMNKRTVNADVLLFSEEAWEHLGGISTLSETVGAVTNFTTFIYFSS